MSKFLDMVSRDNQRVFTNTNELGEKHTIMYDGHTYEAVPITMSAITQSKREQVTEDYAEGLYLVSAVMHCLACDLKGSKPERGERIKISDRAVPQFFNEYVIASVADEFGLLRIELEVIDE